MEPSVFVSDTNIIGPRIDIAVVVLASVATAVVLGRLVARRVLAAPFWWDDAFIVAATVFMWNNVAATVFGVAHGLGKHDEAINEDEFKSILKQLLWIELDYACCLPCIKASVLLFLVRIFPNKRLRIAAIFLGAVILAWFIAVVFASVFSCKPVQYQWDKTIPGGHCIDSQKFFLGNAIPNILTDVAVLLLPMPLIWKLQMPFRRKFNLSLLFSLGAFVVATSIVRLTYIYGTKTQIWYNLALGNLWTNLEAILGIICVSLPASIPFVRHLWEKRGAFSISSLLLYTRKSHNSRRTLTGGSSECPTTFHVNKNASDSDASRLVEPRIIATPGSGLQHSQISFSGHDAQKKPESGGDEAWEMGKIYMRRDLDVYPSPKNPSPV